MKHNITLTVTSLLTILFSSFHLADDVVRGFEPGGTSNYIGIVIMSVFLYATLMLPGRRSAHLLVMVGSIGGAFVPWLHMSGRGLVGPRALSSGAVFFWVWTILALGVTAIITAILAAHGLWTLQRERSRLPARPAEA